MGTPNRELSPQMRRSARLAISSPPPTQMPCICATTGWRQLPMASIVRRMTAPYSTACRLLLRAVSNSLMSLPGENAFSPAPRSSTQRTPSSRSSSRKVSPSRRQPSMVKALSFSGRFSTTVAMSPSRCSRMGEDSVVEVALMVFLFQARGARPPAGDYCLVRPRLAVSLPYLAHSSRT
ncbi:hypothetical protein D3C72_1728480 [compost metagenome]